MKKYIVIIVSIILVIAAILSFVSFDITDNDNDKRSDSSSSENSSTDSSDDNISSDETTETDDFYESNSHNDDLPLNSIDFDLLQNEYPNAVAWIQIPGIDMIDYPVMQSSPDMEEDFYLDHNTQGESDRAGSIYIQKGNSNTFDDPNTIVYGHNMLNGTMFGSLYENFCDETFFNEHRTIYIFTPGHELKYEIISAFVYDDRNILNSFNFNETKERMEFFNTCLNPNSFTKQIIADANLDDDDKIITLSTYTTNNAERFLVIGKLVKDVQTK